MTDMVPQEVQSAERRDGIIDDPVTVGILGEIGADANSAAAGIGHFLDHSIQSVLIDIDSRHLGTFSGETKGSGPSHARGRSCDQGDFVFQSHSEHSSLWLVNAEYCGRARSRLPIYGFRSRLPALETSGHPAGRRR